MHSSTLKQIFVCSQFLEFGEFLDRYSKNEWIEEDIKTINSRMVDDSIGVMLPKEDDIDMLYECSTNKERNVIATTIFSRCVDETHPLVKQGDGYYSGCDGFTRPTIIPKILIESKEGVMSESFHK